jgi:hypothetical protein
MRVDPLESLYPKNYVEGAVDEADIDGEARPKLIPTKIHLFAIDWAAFKQIRTDDVLSFFKIYGCTYVEWLGELSCNVHFEDKYSAARALEALSRALPEEIPLVPKGSDKSAVEEVKMEESGQEDNGIVASQGMFGSFDNTGSTEEGTVTVTATVSNNNATTPNGQSQITSEVVTDAIVEELKPVSTTNLGSMGWRFCNYPLRKIQSDRYGKRGTRSRCLFRIATSLDALAERPTSWPKPPPGFTTKRVLGPGDDHKTWSDQDHRRKRRRDDRGGGKRRRRSRGGNYDDEWERDRGGDYDDHYDDNNNNYHQDEEPEMDEFGRSAIDKGLKAGRAGFSMEQIEAERNAKLS